MQDASFAILFLLKYDEVRSSKEYDKEIHSVGYCWNFSSASMTDADDNYSTILQNIHIQELLEMKIPLAKFLYNVGDAEIYPNSSMGPSIHQSGILDFVVFPSQRLRRLYAMGLTISAENLPLLCAGIRVKSLQATVTLSMLGLNGALLLTELMFLISATSRWAGLLRSHRC